MKRLSAKLLALGLVVCSVSGNAYAAAPTPVVYVREAAGQTDVMGVGTKNILVGTETVSEEITEQNPFLFPTEINSSKTLEAELGILNNTGPADERWKLNVATASWASQGKFINCLNENDTVTYHFYAKKAGTYTVKVTYRSGSPDNALSWSGTNVVSGTQTAGHSD